MTARHQCLHNLTDVDLRLLRVFCAVALSRGFSAAQPYLGISSSNISIRIGQLEQRLRVRLCERGRKGFRLTEEGRLIYGAALSLFRATDDFRVTVGSALGRLVGDVHFGFVDAIVSDPGLALEQTLAIFSKTAPECHLILDISSPQELTQGLLEERYHAVLSPRLERRDLITYVQVGEERKSLYCGRKHQLFGKADAAISKEQLVEEPAVVRSYKGECLNTGSFKLRNCATASHMESIALMILSGCFIGYLPEHYALTWVSSGEMRPLLRNELSYVDCFHLAYRTNENNRTAQAFIEHLTRRAAPLRRDYAAACGRTSGPRRLSAVQR